MQEVFLNTKSRPSAVTCGAGAFGAFLREFPENAFLVTDSNVARIYADFIAEHFAGVPRAVVPAGERSKNAGQLLKILDAMLAARMHRNATVIALGGGVIGDMAGLAAALYMRGVRIVQIPTTLLAQVDSSVGGKTAVDRGGVKNVIGAFWQPERVYCDPLFLHTLPAREIKCGLGEILKTGVLCTAVGDRIAANGDRLRDYGFLEEITAECVRFKARVVEEDETERSGVRKCLNLGHTTGHALELCYGRRSHGEYVLIGMWLESFIAEREGICSPEHAAYVRGMVSLAERKIPVFPDAGKCLPYALLDKKNTETDRVSVLLSSARGQYREYNLSADRYAGYLRMLAGARDEGSGRQ